MAAGDLGAGVPVGRLDDGVDPGPLRGLVVGGEVRVPGSALRRHALVVGRSGVGKSTLVKRVTGHFLGQRARGEEGRTLVVVDPHGDVVQDILKLVPEEVADRVRLLDFGRMDRVPGINLIDPQLFPDREWCVAGIVQSFRNTLEWWGGAADEFVGNGLRILYEYNSDARTGRSELMSVLNLLPLLEEGVEYGSGARARREANAFQRRVLARVRDPWLVEWFHGFLHWDRSGRGRLVGSVLARLGSYASDLRALVALGQSDSTVSFGELLAGGSVVLVSTAPGVIGRGPAALLGGAVVSLVETEGHRQSGVPVPERSGIFLVCEDFGGLVGVDWGSLLGEARKWGCSVMLSTQSLSRLGGGEVSGGVLGNVGCLVGHQMMAEDARVLAAEMDSGRVQEGDLVSLDPHQFLLRVSSDARCYPAFRVRGLGPFGLGESPGGVEATIVESSEAYTREWSDALAGLSPGVAGGVSQGG